MTIENLNNTLMIAAAAVGFFGLLMLWAYLYEAAGTALSGLSGLPWRCGSSIKAQGF